MTLRQVHMCLKYIDTRKHNEYALKAALHGHKIKLKGMNKPSQSEFSQEETLAAEKAMQKAIQRRRIEQQFKVARK